MMGDLVEEAGRVTLGDLAAGLAELVRRNPVPGLVYTVALLGLQVVLVVTDSTEISFWPMLLATMVGCYFLVERIMVAEGLADSGRPLRHFATCIGIMLLVALLSLFGFAFFIIPGLIILARWSAAIPLAIGADLSVFGAMSRSWELTRKSMWSLAGFYALFLLGQAFAGGLVFGVQRGPISASGVAGWGLANLFDAIGMYVMVAVVRKLRPATDRLDEIFS